MVCRGAGEQLCIAMLALFEVAACADMRWRATPSVVIACTRTDNAGNAGDGSQVLELWSQLCCGRCTVPARDHIAEAMRTPEIVSGPDTQPSVAACAQKRGLLGVALTGKCACTGMMCPTSAMQHMHQIRPKRDWEG